MDADRIILYERGVSDCSNFEGMHWYSSREPLLLKVQPHHSVIEMNQSLISEVGRTSIRCEFLCSILSVGGRAIIQSMQTELYRRKWDVIRSTVPSTYNVHVH